ncbi:GntR family transcriptional regulator [Embleya sp. NBC_00896]|uniref:GntR family transcriptional regulator n=1 Tax=Embleya sp. NBC_00896 TaxID=2975961 RepID=UPI0038636097|nr:GntR family transcriptional regulator [Embleya sp. NBC_00896]
MAYASPPGYRTGGERRPGSLTGSAYREIRRRVLHLELVPGARFTEKAVAEELGVSKTPVHEALALLAEDGLVEVIPRSGYRVSRVTLRSTRELFDLHCVLEQAAAAAVARRAPAIRPALARAGAWVPGPAPVAGPNAWLDRYTRLHLTIADLAGNRHLRRVLGGVLYAHHRLLRLCATADVWDLRPLAGDDAPLLAALGAGDEIGARVAVAARLTGCRERVLAALLSDDAVLDANVAGSPGWG